MIETDSFTNRLIAADTASPQEDVVERALRPKKLADYVAAAEEGRRPVAGATRRSARSLRSGPIPVGVQAP